MRLALLRGDLDTVLQALSASCPQVWRGKGEEAHTHGERPAPGLTAPPTCPLMLAQVLAEGQGYDLLRYQLYCQKFIELVRWAAKEGKEGGRRHCLIRRTRASRTLARGGAVGLTPPPALVTAPRRSQRVAEALSWAHTALAPLRASLPHMEGTLREVVALLAYDTPQVSSTPLLLLRTSAYLAGAHARGVVLTVITRPSCWCTCRRRPWPTCSRPSTGRPWQRPPTWRCCAPRQGRRRAATPSRPRCGVLTPLSSTSVRRERRCALTGCVVPGPIMRRRRWRGRFSSWWRRTRPCWSSTGGRESRWTSHACCSDAELLNASETVPVPHHPVRPQTPCVAPFAPTVPNFLMLFNRVAPVARGAHKPEEAATAQPAPQRVTSTAEPLRALMYNNRRAEASTSSRGAARAVHGPWDNGVGTSTTTRVAGSVRRRRRR